MKAIMVMFDSLRRDFLSTYGGEVETPNFNRLASLSVQFDNSFVGSLPCMPARRELHTGRYNFLHRSWGPLEPFDDSMPELLSSHGVHTHLSTDHYHYLQDGGATYQGRYSTWTCHRGQEGDQWIADLSPVSSEFAPNQLSPENATPVLRKIRKQVGWQNMYNRSVIRSESDYPMVETFDNGIDFLDRNGKYDNWFLQIETFDPHEPFTSPTRSMAKFLSPDEYASPDWPQYSEVSETEDEIETMRGKYKALLSFCDEQLGRVLDKMDELDLWDDTMLIVNTDHGFMLSEHGYWGKGTSPCYEELVHTPLFMYDPRSKVHGERRKALVQTIDIAPTLLDLFGVDIPKDMRGQPLGNAIASDTDVRDYAIFGYLGGPVGVTDGRYVLLRAVADPNVEIHEYTLMPTHMNRFFSQEEFAAVELSRGFPFMKGYPVLKTKAKINPRFIQSLETGKDLMFDLERDPGQGEPINDPALHERLLSGIRSCFKDNDAPEELWAYYGLNEMEEYR